MSPDKGQAKNPPQSPVTAEEIERMQRTGLATSPPPAHVATEGPPEPPEPVAPKEEQVWIVVFNEKSHPNDTNDVVLCVNGDMHQQKRGVEGPCPDRFLEVADRAVYPHYKQEPGKPRKVAAHIQRYLYRRLRPSTMTEYRQWRTDGTKKNLEYVEKYGMEAPSQG